MLSQPPVAGEPLSAAFGRVFNTRTVAAAFYLSAVVALSRALTWLPRTPDHVQWLVDALRFTRQSLISSLAILLCVALASAAAHGCRATQRQSAWAEGLAVLPGAVLGAVLRHAVAGDASQPWPWTWFFYTVGLWTWLGWFGQAMLRATRQDWLARQRLRDARRAHEAWATPQIEARLSALQAQIEPHFLFNTLATVKRLYETAPEQGREMMTHLTAYLRAALPALRHRLGRLDEELARVRHYLSLLQMRMGPRLSFELRVDPDLQGAAMPPMAVLTLVENAVKHGLSPLPEGGRIEVVARVGDDQGLWIDVMDNGRGFDSQGGSGVGLANTRARLQALYGERATLSLAAGPQQRGVTASLRLPLQALADADRGAEDPP